MSAFEYEIRVRGRLTATLAAEFDQLCVSSRVQPVETLLRARVGDQAALHGLLRRVDALGLELVEVRRREQDGAEPGVDGGQKISS